MATSKKKEDISTPCTLDELINYIKTAAEKFGFSFNNENNKGNGRFKNCIDSSPNNDDHWFGYIRADQPQTGGYEGLSFVIFPEKEKKDNKGSEEEKHTYCLAAISIGSDTVGADCELASSLQFRRSFYSLTKGVPRERLFFFKNISKGIISMMQW